MADSVPNQKKRKYYRGRKERAVLVYTINQESRYLKVSNVPALGNIKELMYLFSKCGEVESYYLLDDEICEDEFTDVYWIKYKNLDDAKNAKLQLDDFPFLGSQIRVNYAPEYESMEETRQKLEWRRLQVLERIHQLRDPVYAPGMNNYPDDVNKIPSSHPPANHICSIPSDTSGSSLPAEFASDSSHDVFAQKQMTSGLHNNRHEMKENKRLYSQIGDQSTKCDRRVTHETGEKEQKTFQHSSLIDSPLEQKLSHVRSKLKKAPTAPTRSFSSSATPKCNQK